MNACPAMRGTRATHNTRRPHPAQPFPRPSFRGRLFGEPIVTFVGAGVVRSGVGALASPWSCSYARVPPPSRATQASPPPQPGLSIQNTSYPPSSRATQASPPRTTRPPPLRVRSHHEIPIRESPSPAPTGMKALSRRCHTIPTRGKPPLPLCEPPAILRLMRIGRP